MTDYFKLALDISRQQAGQAIREVYGAPDVFTIRPSTPGEVNPETVKHVSQCSNVMDDSRPGYEEVCGRECKYYCVPCELEACSKSCARAMGCEHELETIA